MLVRVWRAVFVVRPANTTRTPHTTTTLSRHSRTWWRSTRTLFHTDAQYEDPYRWLQRVDDWSVQRVLKQERKHADRVRARLGPTAERLHREMAALLEEDVCNPPEKLDDYWYYTRARAGEAHWVYCRRKGSMDAPEEVVYNQNLEAAQYPYTHVGMLKVSSDHKVCSHTAHTLTITENCVHHRYYR